MIIQCRKCETRFRFDEKLMEGDGIWVRCSRCQHVFFQERPTGDFPAAESEIPSVRISDAKRTPGDRFPVGEKGPIPTEGEAEIPLQPRAGVEQTPVVEFEKEPSLGVLEESLPDDIEEDLGKEPLGGPVTGVEREEEAAEEEEEEEEAVEDGTGRKRWGRMILKLIALVVFLVIVAGAVSLYLMPELRNRALMWVSPWVRGVPVLENLIGAEKKSGETVLAPVRIRDVRQRSVANLLMGNLRVIEGFAVNQAPYPLARIRVRLVIADAYDVVLGEKTVSCGNLLTDVELGAMAEVEIQRELSIPQGSDVSNERIAPNGEIPFMIVFSQEQAGAVKTTVMPAGFDRLP
ncbi:MAG: zinc-ribbon domain-containing protein [Deltaproteobacteria bacterium]|nr:zinc-ribbon domain-containing protein [Deltaproteobacteria bacterium]